MFHRFMELGTGRLGVGEMGMTPKETAAQDRVSYSLDFDRRHWFIRRDPCVIAGGFDTKEEAWKWLQEFLEEKASTTEAK